MGLICYLAPLWLIDSHSTYFPMLDEQLPAVKVEEYPERSEAIAINDTEISNSGRLSQLFPLIAPTVFSRNEIKSIEGNYRKEQLANYANRQIEKYSRLVEYSLDDENILMYSNQKDKWLGRFFRHAYFKSGRLDTGSRNEFERFKEAFNALSEEQVVNKLRKESEGWIKSLSEEETRAIKKYTYNPGDKRPKFYERLNAMLRGSLPKDKSLEYYGNKISEGINKYKLEHNVIAYRGTTVDFTNGAKEGTIIDLGQFTSTSVSKKGMFNMGYRYTIFVRKGSRAAYIENLSFYKSQRELLIDKNAIFRVLYRQGNDIYLEVI